MAHDDTQPVSPSGDEFDDPRAMSRWPKAIGITAIIYGSLGLLCQSFNILWVSFSQQLMKMGGMDVEFPAFLKYTTAGVGIVVSLLGIVLLVGGVRLLKRRPSGVKLLKTWAILRVLFLMLATGLGIFLLPANINLQRSIQEATNEAVIEAGRPEQARDFDEEAVWRRTVLMTGGFTLAIAAFPVFLGLYLGRRRIADEVDQWLEYP